MGENESTAASATASAPGLPIRRTERTAGLVYAFLSQQCNIDMCDFFTEARPARQRRCVGRLVSCGSVGPVFDSRLRLCSESRRAEGEAAHTNRGDRASQTGTGWH